MGFAGSQISGTIPTEIGAIAPPHLLRFSESLTRLTFGGTSISGTIPDLTVCGELQELGLQHTLVSGTLPSLPSGVLEVDLSAASLEGLLSDLQCPTLRYLRLGDNYLAGTIPDLQGAPQLRREWAAVEAMETSNAGKRAER